jgi:hypothetical protein
MPPFCVSRCLFAASHAPAGGSFSRESRITMSCLPWYVSPVAHAENVFTVSFSCRQPLAWLRNGKSCRFEDYSQIPVHRLCPVPIQVACTCSLLQCLCLYYSSLQRYLRLRPSLGIPFPSPTSACPSPRMPKLGLSDAAPPHPARRINIISSHRSSYQILRIYKQTG